MFFNSSFGLIVRVNSTWLYLVGRNNHPIHTYHNHGKQTIIPVNPQIF